MDERETRDFDHERSTELHGFDADDFDTLPDPEQVAHYKILGKIGEGGFGVVYEAQQESPVKRRVALKVIKPGMDSKAVVTRFHAERQALALMTHPNIAKVLDGGITERGLPYFVMELVKGEPITDFCDRNKLALADRLRLLIPVCHAVQHAHSKAVIHRDLKPSNILVGYNSEGHPHPTVIDFGVAKALNHQLSEHSIFTTQGQMIGTPEYMSPEQAEMSGVDIDTRTDVYSLGVVLYELLTGMLPVEPKELRSKMYREMQRMIREFVPPKPSTRLGGALSTIETRDKAKTVASSRRMSDSELSRTLRGELDWIVMKCLEKDRDRRYSTPTELALELEHYLNNEPVTARPPSASYRMRKLIRRNRGAFVATGIIAATLVVATAVSIRYSLIANLERDKAQQALNERDKALSETELALERTERQLKQIQGLIRIYSDYEEQIRRIEGATAARTRLAEATIHVLDQLATEYQSERWISEELANGYLAAGQIYAVKSESTSEILGAFTKAQRLFTELSKQDPSDAQASIGLAQSLVGLAAVQIGNAQSNTLMAYATQAESICDSLVVDQTLEPTRIRVWARSILTQADLALTNQQLSDAAELAQRVIDHDLDTENPDINDIHWLDVEADAMRTVGMALREQGHLDDAISTYEQGIEVRERALQIYPSDAVLRRGLIRDLHWLGRVTAYDMDDPEGAATIYRKALTHSEHLRRADPDDGAAYELILDQRKALATALRRAENLEEATEETRLLIKAAQDYVNQDPLDRMRQRRLFAIQFDEARVQYRSALDLLRSGSDHDSGIDLLRESIKSFESCSDFYQDLIQHDTLGSYDKFSIDAAEVALQHAKAVETLGKQTDDPVMTESAIDIYQKAADLYTINSSASELAHDQKRNLSIAYRNIGTIALSIPDGEQAVRMLERADQVLPLDRWDAYARKAEAYRLAGNSEMCRFNAQRAFDLIEEFAEPKKSQTRLRVQGILDALEDQ